MNIDQIQKLESSRLADLETLKPDITRKTFYIIEEKLAAETSRLNEILDWQQGKQNKLSRYSLILDPHYFDQEFLS